MTGTSPISIGGATTLTGSNQNRTWTLTSSNSGTLGGFPASVSFSNVGGLIGGTVNDTFQFANGVTWAGSIDGGAGTDALNYSAFTSPVTINLAALGATNIESVVGSSSATSILVGTNTNNT